MIDLDAIEARAAAFADAVAKMQRGSDRYATACLGSEYAAWMSASDVPALVAEVRGLVARAKKAEEAVARFTEDNHVMAAEVTRLRAVVAAERRLRKAKVQALAMLLEPDCGTSPCAAAARAARDAEDALRALGVEP